jgi:hypothetical protein
MGPLTMYVTAPAINLLAGRFNMSAVPQITSLCSTTEKASFDYWLGMNIEEYNILMIQ